MESLTDGLVQGSDSNILGIAAHRLAEQGHFSIHSGGQF